MQAHVNDLTWHRDCGLFGLQTAANGTGTLMGVFMCEQVSQVHNITTGPICYLRLHLKHEAPGNDENRCIMSCFVLEVFHLLFLASWLGKEMSNTDCVFLCFLTRPVLNAPLIAKPALSTGWEHEGFFSHSQRNGELPAVGRGSAECCSWKPL